MNDERRNERLRLLISRLNKERKKQAKQIDILCNDFIAAQKEFIKALQVIGFAADFYESIAGLTNLNELLYSAGNLIRGQLPDANVAFFLLQGGNFELHIFESEQAAGPEDGRIENCFTVELVDNIAKSNKVCAVEDMLAMGLQSRPTFIEKVSAAAVPLCDGGRSLGFVLVYRSAQNPLTGDELTFVTQVIRGLARSIGACRELVGGTTTTRAHADSSGPRQRPRSSTLA